MKRHATLWSLWIAVAFAALLGAVLLWQMRGPTRLAEGRIKLVDDFNDGSDTNLIGGEPFTQAFSGGRVVPSFLRMETPSPGEMACAIAYDLPQGASVSWGTGLNDLDISAATHLRLWLRLGQAPAPTVSVELIDGTGARAETTLRRVGSAMRWQQLAVPVGAFRGVDWNRLARLIIRIAAPKRAAKGTLYLDDVAFAGPAPLFFRSLQDNLLGFPSRPPIDRHRLLRLSSRQMLQAIARDTWGYFRDIVDARHHLPLNYIQLQPEPVIGDYASTTDTAMYLLAVVSAQDLDLIDYVSARERLRGTLERLAQLPKWEGHLYNYYSTTNLQITRQYVSSVDNAWLAAALIVVRQAFPELAPLAATLLEPMDFGVFYDPHNGQMRLGYEAEEGRLAPYHYGLLATEARIISVVAIGKGDVPEQHWFRVYRTLPKEWTWQRQAPSGEYKTYQEYDVFQGYYVYPDGQREIPFVPSWGGSLFEFLMPTLVLDEQQLAPEGLGLNNQRAVEIHIRYALQERAFPVWGLSPCATPKGRHGGYSEYGVAALGAKGYKDEAIVTPHASILALTIAPEAVERNLRELLRRYDVYGPYGFYDSVDVVTGDVAYRYLALDQGMILVALNNYLNQGAIQRRFAADPVMQRVEPLLRVEQFFSGADGVARPVGQVSHGARADSSRELN